MSNPASNRFMAVWPPAADDAFAASPEMRRARHLYADQKVALRGLMAGVLGSDPATDTQEVAGEIAVLLHNISGTAAFFGEGDLGSRARDLEQPVRSAFTAGLMRPLCGQMLAVLDN